MVAVPNFPAYQVDAEGQVSRNGAPLKASLNAKGYARVFLRRDGKTHTRYIHRIVCEAFNGAPQAGDEARHLNGIRNDNRAGNLAWGDHLTNEADKEAHGTIAWGETSGNARLTAAIVTRMREAVRGGASMQEAAREFSIHERVAADAITGRRWNRLPGAVPAFTTRRRFTVDEIKEIRVLSGSMTQAAIGKKFGVGRTAIQQILLGKAYQWVA